MQSLQDSHRNLSRACYGAVRMCPVIQHGSTIGRHDCWWFSIAVSLADTSGFMQRHGRAVECEEAGGQGAPSGGGHCSHAIHSVQGTHTRTQECTQETQTTLIKHVFFSPNRSDGRFFSPPRHCCCFSLSVFNLFEESLWLIKLIWTPDEEFEGKSHFFLNQVTLNLVKVLVQLKKKKNRDWKKRTSTFGSCQAVPGFGFGTGLSLLSSNYLFWSIRWGKKSVLHSNSFHPHVPRELHLDFSASRQREVGDRGREGDSVSADEGGYTEENAIHEAGALYSDCMMIHQTH